MTPLRPLDDGELAMLRRCVSGNLEVSKQAAHIAGQQVDKIAARLLWDSLLDLGFADDWETMIRMDRKVHLFRNHACDCSQSAGYRPWRIFDISSSFGEPMYLEDQKFEPLTTPSMSTLVQNQGSEARRKYKVLIRKAVFRRSGTIENAMDPGRRKPQRKKSCRGL
ncbi:hypothetical protein VNI00_017914 [Paramarasmius palmivorus]|uniref:Uncharacterized protein n=1 Tax=Paramarasmius palmivorus TaxID=297713 RepID=A0AAW0B1I0_9AGAR